MTAERTGPLTPVAKPEDAGLETTLRPRRLDQYFGQDKVKENLDIAIRAQRYVERIRHFSGVKRDSAAGVDVIDARRA